MFPSTSMDRALNLSSFADGVGLYMLAAGVGVAIVYNSSWASEVGVAGGRS
jgi:hypothetical protein